MLCTPRRHLWRLQTPPRTTECHEWLQHATYLVKVGNAIGISKFRCLLEWTWAQPVPPQNPCYLWSLKVFAQPASQLPYFIRNYLFLRHLKHLLFFRILNLCLCAQIKPYLYSCFHCMPYWRGTRTKTRKIEKLYRYLQKCFIPSDLLLL
jgi:hypothetical protein